MKKRSVKYIALCDGQCKYQSNKHKLQAEYHSMMSDFYLMSKDDQLVFMAMFDQMVQNSDSQ